MTGRVEKVCASGFNNTGLLAAARRTMSGGILYVVHVIPTGNLMGGFCFHLGIINERRMFPENVMHNMRNTSPDNKP